MLGVLVLQARAQRVQQRGRRQQLAAHVVARQQQAGGGGAGGARGAGRGGPGRRGGLFPLAPLLDLALDVQRAALGAAACGRDV